MHGYVRKYSWRTGPDHLNQPNLANPVTWNVNTTVADTLDVTGATILHNGLSVDKGKPTTLGGTLSVGDTAVGGTLGVTRNIAVGGTLDVTGSTNLNDGALGGKLTVAKEKTLKDKLTVVGDKATGLGGALTVDVATTLKGDLTVQGQQLDLDGGNLAGVRTLSGAKDANNNPVPVTLADVGTLRGMTDGQGNTSAVKVAGNLDLDGGNLAGVRTLSGAKDANNNPIPVTLADVRTLRGTTDGQGNTSAVKVAGDLDLDGGNLAGVRTLSGAKDANNNPVPVTLADLGTLRGTTDGQGNTSAVKVAGDLDLDGGSLAGVRTLSGAKDANNNPVPVTLADVGTLRGTTDGQGNTSAVKVAGDLDLDGGNLAGVRTLSGAKDANNNPVPVTLADVGTLRGTTDGQGNTSAVKVAGDLDLDGGNLAGVRTLSGAKDANNNPVPVTLADVGTLRGTTGGQGNTSAVKVAGDLDLDGGNLAGVRTLSGAKDANNNPVPVTLADVGTLRGTTDGQGNTSAVKVAGDLDLDGGNLAGVRTLSGAKDANNNPVPVTLADVGTLRGTTDGQGNTSAVKVAGDLDLDGGNLAGVRTLSGAKDANNNPVPVTLADVGTLRGTTDGQGNTGAVKVAGNLDLDGGNLAGVHTLLGAKNANNNPVPVTLADVGTLRGTTDGQGNTSAVKVAGRRTVTGTITGNLNGTATNAGHATTATNAGHATTATNADHATAATTATTATNAGHATTATNAGHATTATTATSVAHSREIKVDGQRKATYNGSTSTTVDITTPNNTVSDPLSVTEIDTYFLKTHLIVGRSNIGYSSPFGFTIYPWAPDAVTTKTGEHSYNLNPVPPVSDQRLRIYGSVQANGFVDSTNTCDVRLKCVTNRNVDTGGLLQDLCDLELFKFKFNEKLNACRFKGILPTGERLGVSAQEVQKRFPLAVSQNPILPMEMQEESTDNGDYLTLLPDQLVIPLIGAVQALHMQLGDACLLQPRVDRVLLADGLAFVDIRERWGDVYADHVAQTTKYKCVVTTQNEGGWDATRGVVNGGVLRVVFQSSSSNDLVSYILVCTDM